MVIGRRGPRFAPGNRPPKYYRDKAGHWRSRDDGGKRLTKAQQERLGLVKQVKPKGPKREADAFKRINDHLNGNTNAKWRRRKMRLGKFAYWRTGFVFKSRKGAFYAELSVAFAAMLDDKELLRWMKSVKGIGRATMIAVEVKDPVEGTIGDDNGHNLANNSSFESALANAKGDRNGIDDLMTRYLNSVVTSVVFWVR